MAMLLLLNQLKLEYGWQLVVGHVNHGLRPQASQDAAFVEEAARGLNLEFLQQNVHIEKKRNLSPEEAARMQRRAALLNMQAATECQVIALAHHAQDQAETLLMRLISGTGPTGLAGMRAFVAPWWRPLLHIDSGKLRAFLMDEGQSWCEDHTNQELGFTRNRVRHQLLPSLQSNFNPKVANALGRLAGLCADEEDYWQSWAMKHAAHSLRRQGGDWLVTLPPTWGIAEKRRFLRFVLSAIYSKAQHSLNVHIEQLLGLSQGPTGKSLPLPAGWLAWREPHALVLTRPQPAAWPPLQLDGPASFYWPQQQRWYSMALENHAHNFRARGCQAWLPAQRIAWPLTLALPAQGARFYVYKGQGGRKISWLLQDLKIPRRKRAHVLLLSDSQGPWWLGPVAHGRRLEEARHNYSGAWLKIFPLSPDKADEECG